MCCRRCWICRSAAQAIKRWARTNRGNALRPQLFAEKQVTSQCDAAIAQAKQRVDNAQRSQAQRGDSDYNLDGVRADAGQDPRIAEDRAPVVQNALPTERQICGQRSAL